ncbi:MAG: nicotinate-nucleotide adenylyltransferase [Pseudomonadota bacterium]
MNTQTQPAIGIYGGTFDPVHFGHLRPALEVCETLGLEQIRFIPSYIPPHRQTPETSIENRLLMLETAISSEKCFVMDQREIKRQGHSYMLDTLKSLKNDFLDQPLCLILGLDAFLEINTWHCWEKLLSYCHFVVTRRPETEYDEISSWPPELQKLYQQHKAEHADELHKQLVGKIFFMHVTQLPISSSLIRQQLKNKLSIRYLLPDAVYDIITEKQLYL